MSRRRNKNKARVSERALTRAAEKAVQQQLQASQNPNPAIEFPSSIPSGIALGVSRSVTYAGPVPPPEILEQFNRIDPGRAGKLLQLAEDQSRHRMALENQVITADIRRSWAGLAAAGLACAGVLGCGTTLVLYGHDIAGTTIITGTLVSLVLAFMYGRSSQSAERKEKSKRNP